jgi:hypothetical protein
MLRTKEANMAKKTKAGPGFSYIFPGGIKMDELNGHFAANETEHLFEALTDGDMRMIETHFEALAAQLGGLRCS